MPSSLIPDIPQSPILFNLDPTAINERVEQQSKSRKGLLDKLVQDVSPDAATFSTVLLPIVHVENEWESTVNTLQFLAACVPSKELRDAASAAIQKLKSFGIDMSMREDVHTLIQAVYSKDEELDTESKRLLQKMWDAAVRNGLALPADKRIRFTEIQKRLSDIRTQFRQGAAEENGGIWFTLEEVEGLPDNVLETLDKGTGENEGKVFLTFSQTDYGAAITHVKSGEVRKRYLIAHENKLKHLVPLFSEAMALRDEAARLQGFADHATLRLQERMAKEKKPVLDFLDKISEQLFIGRDAEIEQLLALKKADLAASGLSEPQELFSWDEAHYRKAFIAQQYKVDPQKVSEYFPLLQTTEKMIGIFEKLFGMVFVKIEEQDCEKLLNNEAIGSSLVDSGLIWHEDVSMYAVWDDEKEGGGFLGWLYLDMYPREGKYGHFANSNVNPGFENADGSRHYPVTALLCNFTKPTPSKPSLLKHSEVTMLFHELGHAIHDLCGRSKFARFHGTAITEDFCEAPSQMLEFWCWDPVQLKGLSAHYETGEQLPDDIVENIIKAKRVLPSLASLRQISLGLFDIAVHSAESTQQARERNYADLWYGLREKYTGLRGPTSDALKGPWGCGYLVMGNHLLDVYDVGYYGYLWSEVFAADIFYTFFKENPLSDTEGRRYRHMLLEVGANQDEMVTLTQYLGREPSNKAFAEEMGIKV